MTQVRHPLPGDPWPTAEAAAASQWFSPIRIGTTLIANQRTWVPAMVPWRATADGEVTDDVLEWYGRFADGQPGVIVVEATGIRDIASGPLLRIGHDRYLPGLERLVETVRRRSHGQTRLFIQLIDFLAIRRRPEPDKFFRRFLTVSDALRHRLGQATDNPQLAAGDEGDLREFLLHAGRDILEQVLDARDLESLDRGYRERVWDTHLPHIAALPQVLPGLFADAAERARRAGFDGIELHYAHAYTMASFLSRLNQRTDGYGGSLPDRARLPLEVLAAVRARVGGETVVGCRLLGDEVIAGGSRIDDAVYFGVEFARAGMDFLSVSKGGKFEDARQPKIGEAAYPYTGESGHECMPTVRADARGPFGRNVPLARAIRAAVREAGCTTPIITSGGICSFQQAEDILRRGDADLVAAARQSLADPDWFRKIRLGHGHEVRRCKFTNYCEALDQQHRQVTCQLWDRDFDAADAAVARSEDGRRRLIAPAWRRHSG